MINDSLKNYFYLICSAKEIKKSPKKFQLFGHSFVIVKTTQGGYKAYYNYCPHRGTPLSDSQIVNDQIICPYHGWHFSIEDGDCKKIPALSTCPRFKLKPVALKEEKGYLFACIGDNPIERHFFQDDKKLRFLKWTRKIQLLHLEKFLQNTRN
jgi:vanillate O-demethylase monooxygenase subunit